MIVLLRAGGNICPLELRRPSGSRVTEALAEALPHLQELELWTYADPRLAAEPGALECLASLMPSLSVHTVPRGC